MIDPIYYEGKGGQKPYPIELMLRIIILQSFYDLADMAVMYEILDSRAFSDFCGVSSPEEVPNGDTIGRFRNLLIKHGIDEQIFAQVLSILNKHTIRHILSKSNTLIRKTLKDLIIKMKIMLSGLEILCINT